LDDIGFAERLLALRKGQGLTQKQLSVKIGVNRVTILNYEKGKREPDLNTIKCLSSVLMASTDYLLGLSEYRFPAAIAEIHAEYLALTGDSHEDTYRRKLLNDYIATGRELTIDQLEALTRIASQMAEITQERRNR